MRQTNDSSRSRKKQLAENAFERAVILVNPRSTHIKAAQSRIAAIRGLFPKTQTYVLELHDGVTVDALLKPYADQLGPRTLLCIAGGDGTVNSVISYLLKAPEKAGRTVILPLWGGNANDLAHMLNGLAIRSVLSHIVQQGNIVAIRPLCCELTSASGRVKSVAASNYVSFGASGLAARRFNAALHRNSPWHKVPGGRLLRETATAFAVMARVSTFTIQEADKRIPIYERVFINGSRIAKLPPLPLKLTDDVYYMLTVKDSVWSIFGMYFRELVRKPRTELASSEVVFTCQNETWGQADGEAFKLEAGTRVRVYRSPQPFYALSTRLS